MNPEFTLSFERQVPISAEKCYRGWTEPALMLQWFTPKPWETIDALVEPFAGGRFENVMRSPEGVEMPRGCGCILVAEAGRKLVWTNVMSGGFVPKVLGEGEFGMVVTLDFIDNKEGALYRGTVFHDSQKAMETHRDMGFEPGWNAALDQLIELMS